MRKNGKCQGTSRGPCPDSAELKHPNALRCVSCGLAQNRLATLARMKARRRAGSEPESRREPFHQQAKHSKAAVLAEVKDVLPEPKGPKYFERMVNEAIKLA